MKSFPSESQHICLEDEDEDEDEVCTRNESCTEDEYWVRDFLIKYLSIILVKE